MLTHEHFYANPWSFLSFMHYKLCLGARGGAYFHVHARYPLPGLQHIRKRVLAYLYMIYLTTLTLHIDRARRHHRSHGLPDYHVCLRSSVQNDIFLTRRRHDGGQDSVTSEKSWSSVLYWTKFCVQDGPLCSHSQHVDAVVVAAVMSWMDVQFLLLQNVM